MLFIVYATIWFTENAQRMIEAIASLPDIRLGVISQEPSHQLPAPIRGKVHAHWQVSDALNPQQLAHATGSMSASLGLPVHRLFGAVEQLQEPLAEARELLGIEGMKADIVRNFRDKARMKALFRRAGVPCARHRPVRDEIDAWIFANEVGFPVVIKPLAGAGTQATFMVENRERLHAVLQIIAPAPGREAVIEEFIVGDEFSFETISIAGRPIWHSLTHYLPNPLDAMRNSWIQWCVLLPREVDDPRYDDIREIGRQAVAALGMETGLTHAEWFRRRDGSIAISEIAARPPGAQITTLIARSTDTDFVANWAKLMIYGNFDPPERKYAVGAAFLRGQGRGRVRAVHGWEQANQELGGLITDLHLPHIGQPASASYEGEGYVILRHPETAVVQAALQRLVSIVRVELS